MDKTGDSVNKSDNSDSIQEPSTSIGTKTVNYTEQAWGRPLAPGESEALMKWCDDFTTLGSQEPDEMVIEAIKRALDQNVRKLASVDGRIHIRSFEGQDGQRRWVIRKLSLTMFSF